jgi:co-chaperonin GroES (HSP10)
MELSLLDDRVLVRLEPWTRMYHGVIVIPDSVKREGWELWKGTVMSTGPGQLRQTDGLRNPVEVHEGDMVCFYWAAAELDVTRFIEAGEEYRVISEKSIQAVLE